MKRDRFPRPVGAGGSADAVKGFARGGADSASKPFPFAEAQARAETPLRLRRAQQIERELLPLTSRLLIPRAYSGRDMVAAKNWERRKGRRWRGIRRLARH